MFSHSNSASYPQRGMSSNLPIVGEGQMWLIVAVAVVVCLLARAVLTCTCHVADVVLAGMR